MTERLNGTSRVAPIFRSAGRKYDELSADGEKGEDLSVRQPEAEGKRGILTGKTLES